MDGGGNAGQTRAVGHVPNRDDLETQVAAARLVPCEDEAGHIGVWDNEVDEAVWLSLDDPAYLPVSGVDDQQVLLLVRHGLEHARPIAEWEATRRGLVQAETVG
jgi:hypothetical protein